MTSARCPELWMIDWLIASRSADGWSQHLDLGIGYGLASHTKGLFPFPYSYFLLHILDYLFSICPILLNLEGSLFYLITSIFFLFLSLPILVSALLRHGYLLSPTLYTSISHFYTILSQSFFQQTTPECSTRLYHQNASQSQWFQLDPRKPG